MEAPDTCVFCHEKFSTKEDLQKHFRNHAYDPGVQRPKSRVTKILSEHDALALARRPYVNRTPTPCDVCGQMFASNGAAMTHKFKRHPNSKTHCCPHCGKNFVLKSDYDKHLGETHNEIISPENDIEIFSSAQVCCEICRAKFYSASALEFHIKSAHVRVVKILCPVVTPPPSKKIKINCNQEAQSVYYCHLCGSEYVVKYNLQKHLENGHTEAEKTQTPEKLLQCNMCSAMFYSEKAYNTHNLTHTPDDLYVKDEKHRLQTVTKVDQDFDATRVARQLPAGASGMDYLDKVSGNTRSSRSLRHRVITSEEPIAKRKKLLLSNDDGNQEAES